MEERSRFKAGKIIEIVGFTILVVVSIAVMALVIWINIKHWMK